VTIAVPVLQQRVSPVLDTAARLLVMNDGCGGDRKEFLLGVLPPEALARSLVELHVDVLLCAAVSEPLLRALEREGIRVRSHVCGDVEEVLRAFSRGHLDRDEFRMPGCLGFHGHGSWCGEQASSHPRKRCRKERRVLP